MKRSWLIVALLLSVGINIGVLTVIGLSRVGRSRTWQSADERSAGPPPMERLVERLDLEGDQRQEFLTEQRRFFEAFDDVRVELQANRRRLRSEVASDDPDPELIEALLGNSAELTAKLDRLFVDNVMMARRLLGPRQERIYFGFLERMRRQGDRQRGPDRRP